MRTLTAGFAAALGSVATTLCTAWVVRRRDGVVFGFTDHDRPLLHDGVLCQPATGFDRTSASRASDLSVGEEEIAGALTSDAITEADIAAGRWDGAGIEVWCVDWTNVDNHLLLRTGTIGEITAADGGFRAEVRGPAFLLDQPCGRLFQRFCDADFADGRCTLAAAAWTSTATVAVGSTAREIWLSGAGTFAAGWFSGGRLTVMAGLLAGTGAVIDSHLSDDLGARLLLRQALSEAPAPGTALQLVAGCDKRFETCRDRFANAVNFRGFPHMPGRDFVFSYASGDGDDDGEVLF